MSDRCYLRIRPGLDPETDVVVELDLERSIVLGRDRDCDLVLPSRFVSRRHACFFRRAEQIFVEDLGSTNGVFVSGELIAQPTEVALGDAIQIGPLNLRLEAAREAPYLADSVRITQGQPRLIHLDTGT
jgi:pSer/pThr/pTyr-binding forkhead associated (FHA) protein